MTNPPAETQGFVFNQTMMRIRDPAASLDFYQQVLGMTLYQRVDFADMSFSLYFMGYPSNHEGEPLPADAAERSRFTFQQSALLELTHNWGTETTWLLRGITTATQSLAASATSASRCPTSMPPAIALRNWG